MMILNKIKEEKGQSLVEILVGLTIGALIIGSATISIIVLIRSGTSSERYQQAVLITQDTVERVRSATDSSWSNISSLSKGSDNKHYLVASSTDYLIIEGEEGVIDGGTQRGLVGHWGMDEGSGTTAYDYSINNNTGSITGATATSSCQVGGCLDFDGTNDYVALGNVDSIKNNSVGTISLWVNPQKIDLSFALGWHGSTSNYMRLEIYGDGKVGWYTEVGDVGNSLRSEVISPIGQWTHIAIKQDGINARMFINGELQTDTGNDTWFGTYPTLNLFFADELNWSGYMYEGKIDDVRIYDRALSADEVHSIYNSVAFRRHFYVENVCRTNNASYEIDGVTPCDIGSVKDPNTLKVTVVVEWDIPGGTNQFEVSDYLTRWRNRTYNQTDWSGSAGEDGPYSSPTSNYSTSTNIESSSGSIKVEGIE